MEQGNSSRTSQASVSAALAVANAALRDGAMSVRFPGEDGGQSLADMAQRDLDAALQLLTDRAQYITGSTGAAIALRRNGKNDMMCRATTGSNAPELGVLLSTEYGLSGESVRTRRALRCDDAERDARVNHEVCRELGIASVVVMPVVHDDEVLGVFELFSGKPMAFGERDVSALARLSEMVETAVTLARAAVASEWIENAEVSAVSGTLAETSEAHALGTSKKAQDEVQNLEAQNFATQNLKSQIFEPYPALEEEEHVVEVEAEHLSLESVQAGVPVRAGTEEIPDSKDLAVRDRGDVDINKTHESADLAGMRAWPAIMKGEVNAEAPLNASAAAASSTIPSTSASPAPPPVVAAPVVPAKQEAATTSAATLRSALLRADLQISQPSVVANATHSLNSTDSSLASPNLESSIPASANIAAAEFTPVAPTPGASTPAKRPLLWSSALNAAESQKSAEADRSHVPAAFRNLSQCQACGFPISAGRTLCVECEEKKWRGQLKMPAAPVVPAVSNASPGAAAAPAPALITAKPNLRKPLPSAKLGATQATPKAAIPELSTLASAIPTTVVSVPSQPGTQQPAPMPVFTGSLEPSQSWLARSKYIVGALVLIAGAVAAVLFLR